MSHTLVIRRFFVALLILVLTPVLVFADEGTPVGDIQDILSTPVAPEINSVDYNSRTRELDITYSVANQGDVFVDNLVYAVELYHGEALNESGDLFAPLEYVTGFTGDVAKISPNRSVSDSIQYSVPENFFTGNYFIRFSVYNPEYTSYGLAYTINPFVVEGDGTYVPPIITNLYDPRFDELVPALSGPALSLEDVPQVVITESENPNLFNKILAQDTFVDVTVQGVGFTQEIVEKFDRFKAEITATEDGVPQIAFPLNAPETMTSGSYDVLVTLVDAQGNKIADTTTLRWLIDGFFSRIREVKSTTNYYDEGDAYDITVVVNSVNAEEVQPGLLRVTLHTDENIEVIEKEFQFVHERPEFTIDLNDHVSQSEKMLQKIEIEIIDGLTNETIDTFDMEFANDGKYQNGILIEDNNILSAQTVYLIIAAVIIIFLIALLAKKGPNDHQTQHLAILIIAVSTLFSGWILLNDAVAHTLPVNYSAQYDAAPSGNLGFCPQTAYVVLTGTVSCSHCLNGTYGIVGIELQWSDGLWRRPYDEYQYYPGGEVTSYLVGPYGYYVPADASAPSVNYRGYMRTTWRIRSGFGFCQPAENPEKYLTAYNVNCTVDACPNIPGGQASIPAGYYKDGAGNCQLLDVCPNLAGTQASIPAGYYKDGAGNCQLLDVCPNLAGEQRTVPAPYYLNTSNNRCEVALNASCEAVSTNGQPLEEAPVRGQPFAWKASPASSQSVPLSYTWGADASGNSRQVPASYSSTGPYTASISITQNIESGQTDTAQCSVSVRPGIVVSCSADIPEGRSRANPGDTITWNSVVYGNEGDLTYSWSGTADGNSDSSSYLIENPGRFSATVTATDSNGNTDTATCFVTSSEEGDPTSGDPAGPAPDPDDPSGPGPGPGPGPTGPDPDDPSDPGIEFDDGSVTET